MNRFFGLSVRPRGTWDALPVRSFPTICLFVVAALGTATAPAGAEEWRAHHVPLFVSASHPSGHQGFVRVVNRSAKAGDVVIHAVDDEGVPYGPVTLRIGAEETVHFNSGDLEDGNARKNLSPGIGSGTGDWRLRLRSLLDLEVLAYNRTSDGMLAGLHDLVPRAVVRRPGGGGESMGHRVAIFNPASNVNQVSRLRIINRGDEPAEVTIEGIDDDGASPGTAVELAVPAGAARMVTSQELESDQGEGLVGMLGDGAGKWQLVVTSDEPVEVMNLMTSPTGHLTNLSTASAAREGAAAEHAVPVFAANANPNGYQGFVRVVNRSSADGEVTIEAFDDAGVPSVPVTLDIGGHEAVHFNSGDLEEGNAGKGLPAGVGTGEGDWRLRLRSELDLEVLAYNRTADGLLASLHDVVPYTAVVRPGARDEVQAHYVALFNPGSNTSQVSRLRVINPGAEAAPVTIEGFDDAGASPGPGVELAVPAGASRTLTAQALESGEWGPGVEASGSLGDGKGKWRLLVTSEAPLDVMSLLASPTGHLINLSTTPPSSSDDHGDAIAEATDVAVGSTVSGRIDSPDDVDYFRIQVAQTGILVVSTNGEVPTELELVDTDGNPLPVVQISMCPPSGTINDTSAKATTIARNTASREVEIHAGDIVIARVTGKGQLGGFRLESKVVVPGETADYSRPSHDLQASLARTNWLTFRSGGGSEIAYGDFDGDGDEDIFLHSLGAEGEPSVCFPDPYCFTRATPVEIWENVDNSFVLNTQNFFSGNVPEVVSIRKTLVGDFNGDDKPDLFLATHGPAAPPLPREEPPFLFLSTDNGFVQAQGLDHLDGYNHGAASADIDQDGDLDIFVTDVANDPFFLINDGNGNFEQNTNAVPSAINDQGVYTAELVDVDDDGYPDLLVGGHEEEEYGAAPTAIYWGNSSGEYSDSRRTILPEVNGQGIVVDIDVGDLDCDDNKDIVVNRTGSDPFYVGYYFQVISGLGNRTYSDTTSQSIGHGADATGQWIVWLRLVDVNGDGSLDIATDGDRYFGGGMVE